MLRSTASGMRRVQARLNQLASHHAVLDGKQAEQSEYL